MNIFRGIIVKKGICHLCLGVGFDGVGIILVIILWRKGKRLLIVPFVRILKANIIVFKKAVLCVNIRFIIIAAQPAKIYISVIIGA